MEAFLIILVLMGGLGLLIQLIGLLYYLFRGETNEEENKATALNLLVYGTALLLGSGVVCSLGMGVFG